MNETPFKIIFWSNETKIYTNSEDLGVVNYIFLHVWTLALEGIYHGDKIGIFALDSGNILNMFEIQKYWNKFFSCRWLFEFQNTLINIGPTLYCTIGNDIFLWCVSALKLVSLLFGLIGF